MTATLTLRPATMDDARLLLEWANDPADRAASRNSEPIPWDTHVAWLSGKLADPRVVHYVAEVRGRPVGEARVEARGLEGEISVSVDAAHRNQGVGRTLIRKATEQARADLVIDWVDAWVKEDNPASVRAFVAAGYEVFEADVSGLVYLASESR